MSPPAPHSLDESVRRQAAEWIVRRDRGLSARESIEFELWLAADERHAFAIESSHAAWTLLDRIPDEVGQRFSAVAVARRARRRLAAWGALASAAVLALAWLGLRPVAAPVAAVPVVTAGAPSNPRILTLADGSIVRLNSGGEVVERFTDGERRVELVRGEAHFAVAKNPARPFVVRAGSIEVRAIGTAFNVQLQSAAVAILVTEGRVALEQAAQLPRDDSTPRIDDAAANPPSAVRPPMSELAAGQLAVVSLAPASPATSVAVVDLSRDEIARALAWQDPLLRLGGATLAELATEFQHRTGYRLVLADPALADLRVGGRFRADDIEGFVRLLEDNYGVESATSADGTIILRWSAARR